jgi:hypothetical protein
MAWDDQCFEDSMLWIYDQTDEGGHKCHIRQFDPVSGIYTGLEFTGVHNDSVNDVAGGSCFINDFNGKSVFIGLTQNTPDQIFCMEMCEPGTPEPLLDCTGSLTFDDVTPGGTVNGAFQVGNNGDPGSFLDWEVNTWPIWGTWTFTPLSGIDIPEGTYVTVDVEIVAPENKTTEFTGNIKVINSNNPSEYCEIPITLTTVKDRKISETWFIKFSEFIQDMITFLRNQK